MIMMIELLLVSLILSLICISTSSTSSTSISTTITNPNTIITTPTPNTNTNTTSTNKTTTTTTTTTTESLKERFSRMNTVWTKKLEETKQHDKDTKRMTVVSDTLKDSSGIYNTNTSQPLRLSNTVFITLYNNENGDKRYMHLLKNQLCFCAQYGLKPIIYILNTYDNNTISTITNDFQKIHPSVRTLSYPLQIFYKFLVKKRSINEARATVVDYIGEYPSFKHFGAVTMIIPMLEVIQMGYNFIFFDIDIVFVVDPIPYMIKSNADIVVSQETRMCQRYISLLAETNDWSLVEPNTGAMYVKANPKTLNLFHSWINTLMSEQPVNDQFHLSFRTYNAKYNNDCHHGSYNAFNYSFENGMKHTDSSISYCFFEEFLFQNGVVGCHCQNGFRRSNINTWPMMMSRYGVSSLTSLPSLRDHQKKLKPTSNRPFYHPVIMHMNYVGDKIKCARDKGAFIYDVNRDMCYNFNLLQSHWAKMDWRSVIWDATENLNYSDVTWLNHFLSKSVDKMTFLNKTADNIGLTRGYSTTEIDMITDYIVNTRNIVPFTL